MSKYKVENKESGSTMWKTMICLFALSFLPAFYLYAQRNESEAEYPVNNFTRIQKLHTNGDIIRLVRQPVANEANIIVLEAEEADFLRLESQGELIRYDRADESRYIHFVKEAIFRFKVNSTGRYRVWYRTYFPFKANWNHAEFADSQEPRTVIDSSGDRQGGMWLWLKGPLYYLDARIHSFTLDGYHGGARLDKIIFAPDDFIPHRKGPAPSYEDAPEEGRLFTSSMIPQGIEKWLTLKTTAIPGGGIVKVEYSQDSGETWRGLPSDGNLSNLRPGPERYKGIRLDFILRASEEGITPILQKPTLTFWGKRPVILSNGKVALKFSGNDGSLIGTKNLQNGQSCMLPILTSHPLFSLAAVKNKRLVEHRAPLLKEQNIREDRGEKTLIQKFVVSGERVEATVTVTLAGSEKVFFDLLMTNKSSENIVYVDFPRLAGLRIGKESKDDFFFIPKVLNNLYKYPGDCPRLWQTSKTYERSGAMKWVELWDRSGGLYLASYDPTFRDTGMIVDEWDNGSIEFHFRKYTYLTPGRTWHSQRFCIAPHLGDWHWSAKEYRDWARRHVKSPDNPRWVKEEFDGFLTFAGPLMPVYGYSNSSRVVMESSAKNGPVDLMGNRQGFSSNQTYVMLYPYPNPTWGGANEFSQSNEIIKQFGGHSIYYINWHLIHPGFASSPRIGGQARNLLPKDVFLYSKDWVERNAVLSPSGTYPHPHPEDPYFETALCAASREVMRYKFYWAEKYVKEFNTDGVYWDTFADTYAPCFNPDHTNGDLGQWSNRSAQTLTQIIEATRPFNPHAVYAGEGMQDINLAQYNNLHIAETNVPWYEFFRYVFPEWIIVGGGFWAPAIHDPEDNLAELNYGFLTGVRFLNPDITGGDGRLPRNVPADYGLKLLALRRQTKQLLYPAIYEDVEGLEIESSAVAYRRTFRETDTSVHREGGKELIPSGTGILAKRFILKRNGTSVELINTVNTRRETDAMLLLRNSPLRNLEKVWLFTVEGGYEEQPFERVKGLIRMPFPSSLASTLVLVEKCGPLLYLDAPAYSTWETRVRVTVRIRNLNSLTIEGNLRINTPGGFSSKAISFGPIEPGMTQERGLELKVGPSVKAGRYEFEVVADCPGLKTSRIFWTYVGQPLRVTIEENPRQLGLDICLENFAARAIKGVCALIEDEELSTPKPNYEFSVGPSKKTTLTAPLELKKRLEAPRLAGVRISYENYAKELVKSIRPAVPNPDFEIDIAGDRHPDYWAAYGGAFGPLEYNRYGLDPTEKYSGRYSLWVAPPLKAGKENGIYNLSTAIRLGKKYRFKIAIKREVESKKVYASLSCCGQRKTIGQDGRDGRWELFETVFTTPRKNPSESFYPGNLGYFHLVLHNGSSGRAWFDAVSLEEIG